MLNSKFLIFFASFIAIANYFLCVQGYTFANYHYKDFIKIQTNTSFTYKNNLFPKNNERKKPNDYQKLDRFNTLQNDSWKQIEQKSGTSGTPNMVNREFFNYLNVSKYPGELCNRACQPGQQYICYFEFTLEHYQAMGAACGKCSEGVKEDCKHPQCIIADGVERGVMSINRQIPGPAIQVCKNDLVIVDVHNHADGTSASLHWHGIHMVKTPFMDGVPFVTQCPIQYGSTFRYKYIASEPGTQFYHSHSGHHKSNGQYGVLTVRQPIEEEPLGVLYDYDLPEHHVFITDWMHTYAEHNVPGLPTTGISPASVLINGRGVFTNPTTFERSNVRPTIYYVARGKRYLFRLVNSGSHACPFLLQIQNHNFTIIASDSFAALPHIFDTLISNAGERYDFILEANQPIGDYWVRVTGLGACAVKPIESYALLRYIEEKFNDDQAEVEDEAVPPFPNFDELFPASIVLNHPNATCSDGESSQCITELTAFDDDEELRNNKPDHQFFLAFNNYVVPNEEVYQPGQYFHFQNVGSNLTMIAAINNLSLIYPDSPPLTQPESLDESQTCDSTNRPERCKDDVFCHCVHILKVKLHSIVELIIVDESPTINRINHPFHLHGYRFMVTGLGQDPLGIPMTVKRAKELEKNRILSRDAFNPSPVFKDTVSIPSRGYAIVRLRANNPGFWLMHCHYEWHLSVGMGLILQVGEPSDMVKAPRDFPKCSSFVPRVKTSYFESI